MASSDNLPTIEPWMMSRLPLEDTWMISDPFSRDTETFTKAIHKTLSVHPESSFPFSFPSAAVFDLLRPSEPPTTPAVSGISGSEPDTPTAAVPVAGPPPTKRPTAAGGKIAKRKSRASKRTHTTFFTADVTNFRQMVQQVTGVRFGSGQLPVAPVIKPEPQRAAGNRPQGCLPMLDTSAFLLDPDASQHYYHQLGLVAPNSAAATSQHPSLSFPPAMAVDGAAALEFDSFGDFPTLESWKVM